MRVLAVSVLIRQQFQMRVVIQNCSFSVTTHFLSCVTSRFKWRVGGKPFVVASQFSFGCDVVELQLTVVALLPHITSFWVICNSCIFNFLSAVSVLDFSQPPLASCGCCRGLWMGDSSSDTTHEAILHNLVSHQRRLSRQVTQIQTDIQSLQVQLTQIQTQLQLLLVQYGSEVPAVATQQESDTSPRHDRGHTP